MKSGKYVLLLLASLSLLASIAAASEVFSPEEIAATVDFREVENKPEPIEQEQPVVTPDLRNQSGRVYVAFIVCEQGKVSALRCIKSTNNTLNTAVLDAVSRWKFNPAKNNGSIVAVRVVLPIRVDFS